jgi:hypothetical protein
MSLPVASPAKTLAMLASELASKVRGLACGQSTHDLLANYDRATQSWRTSQACLVSGWELFSETWPRSGSMQSGIAYRLVPSAPLTDVIECGLWPTPDAAAANVREDPKTWLARQERLKAKGYNGNGAGMPLGIAAKLWPTPTAGDSKASGSRNTENSKAHAGISLTDAVRQDGGRGRMWPTPQAANSKSGVDHHRAGRPSSGGDDLVTAVMRWPTPASRDYRHPNKKPYSERGGGSKGEQLPNAVGGALNPTWVEWLMGYPLGWTDLSHSATPSSHRSPSSSERQSSKRRRRYE